MKQLHLALYAVKINVFSNITGFMQLRAFVTIRAWKEDLRRMMISPKICCIIGGEEKNNKHCFRTVKEKKNQQPKQNQKPKRKKNKTKPLKTRVKERGRECCCIILVVWVYFRLPSSFVSNFCSCELRGNVLNSPPEMNLGRVMLNIQWKEDININIVCTHRKHQLSITMVSGNTVVQRFF